MPITVRPLRADEGRTYLEIVNRAIRGLATGHYASEVIEGWVVPVTDDSVRALMLNTDHEIRLILELDGNPVGIGALVLERSELRACYVSPQAARQGCGSARRIAQRGSVLCGAWIRGPREKRDHAQERPADAGSVPSL